MKKMIFAAACLLFCGSVIATEYTANTPTAIVERATEWEDCGSRQITKFSGRNISIKTRSSADIRRDGSTIQAYYNGSWRTCRYSNRDGYDYMFSDGSSYWYFNL